MGIEKPPLARHLIWAGVPALAIIIFIAGIIIFNRYYHSAPSFPHSTITVQHMRGGATVSYDVELATTSPQRSYGLMFRHSLAVNTGMLFLWDTEQPATFWMKNTYIPLDMLFVRHDGIIVKIVAHAKPLDLSYIASGEPVRGVIEIGGGEADRLGIETGDKVLYSAFSDTNN